MLGFWQQDASTDCHGLPNEGLATTLWNCGGTGPGDLKEQKPVSAFEDFSRNSEISQMAFSLRSRILLCYYSPIKLGVV